jgi:hypothetical protein
MTRRVGPFGGAILAVVLLLACWGPLRAQEGAIMPTHRLGDLLYAVPDGFQAVGGADGVMMARTAEIEAGTITGMLVVPRALMPDADSRAEQVKAGPAATAQAVAVAVGNLAAIPDARMSEATLMNDAARDGYEAWQVVTVSEDPDAGKTRYSAFVVVFLPTQIQVLSAHGFGNEQALADLGPGFTALLASSEFASLGGRVPAPELSALPPDFAALMPPRPAESAAGGASGGASGGTGCYTVQRQMCSGGIGSGLGYFCNTYPETVCD